MSLEIKIPQEITKYEAKLIGPLTSRQTLWSVLGGVAVIAVNYLVKLVSPDSALAACFFTAIPFALMGVVKIYGMPFEKYAIGYIQTKIFAPQKRKSKVKNQFAIIDAEMSQGPNKKTKYKKSKLAYK